MLRSDPNGSILRLGDIATIRDGFADVDLIQQFNGRQSLFVKVQKSEAEDALTIAAAVKQRLQTYVLDSGVDIAIWDDQTDILEQRLGLLIRNGILLYGSGVPVFAFARQSHSPARPCSVIV